MHQKKKREEEGTGMCYRTFGKSKDRLPEAKKGTKGKMGEKRERSLKGKIRKTSGESPGKSGAGGKQPTPGLSHPPKTPWSEDEKNLAKRERRSQKLFGGGKQPQG